jgi:hypothetical protein
MNDLDRPLTYYFSTHGWSRVESSLLSPALDLELPDAATAAARALLLKKDAAIMRVVKQMSVTRNKSVMR